MKGSSRGIYVCVEGLDGSGKSTLLRGLCRRLGEADIRHEVLCPTRAWSNTAPEERFFERLPALRSASIPRAVLYAIRSARAVRAVDWSAPIVLGDRSVVTSYACRWRKWMRSSGLTVAFVDLLEPLAPPPDDVLYLDVPWRELDRRMAERARPRDIDENQRRSEEMRRAYEEICLHGKVRRLRRTRWHRIDASSGPERVEAEAWGLLMALHPSLCPGRRPPAHVGGKRAGQEASAGAAAREDDRWSRSVCTSRQTA